MLKRHYVRRLLAREFLSAIALPLRRVSRREKAGDLKQLAGSRISLVSIARLQARKRRNGWDGAQDSLR
jgi:hypothetical protein